MRAISLGSVSISAIKSEVGECIQIDDCTVVVFELEIDGQCCAQGTLRRGGAPMPSAAFREADLTSAVFTRCDLTNADLRGTTLADADIRGHTIDGMRAGTVELRRAIADEVQALALIRAMGITIA